jgi:hypothetical protein
MLKCIEIFFIDSIDSIDEDIDKIDNRTCIATKPIFKC